jgi:hypothetical protein
MSLTIFPGGHKYCRNGGMAFAHHHGGASGEEGAGQTGPRSPLMVPVAAPRKRSIPLR